MSYWNYRVIKTTDSEEASYDVHEVHYSDDGDIEYWSSEPCAASGETIKGLKEDLLQQIEAIDNPILVRKGLFLIEIDESV